MHNIPNLSAQDMAEKLRLREVTASEVLATHRAQVEKINPEVNAFVTFDWEAAEKCAAELDTQAASGSFAGPLHGIPIGIKDIFETKKLCTTWGSLSFEDHTPNYDALHVSRLRQAGAVIVVKTNTPEFAFSGQTSNLLVGTTRNPLDTTRTVGGSSGGAAAALSAHMVALADGSDLAGSVRSPAAWCGLVGFRPSSGLVPYDPNPVPFDGLSIPGPMARTVTDLVLMLEVMQGAAHAQPIGYTGKYPSVANLSNPLHPGKIAFTTTPFGSSPDASIQRAISAAAPLCRDLGWTVEDAEPNLAPLLDYAHLTRGLSAIGVQSFLKPDMTKAGESFHTACASADGLSLRDFAEYQTLCAEFWTQAVHFFETYAFALWPTTCSLAFSADLKDGEITEDWRTVMLTPALELPSISIPFGTGSDGLPVGLHVTGPNAFLF